MPAWMTPELWPVWWAPISGSRSSTTTRSRGWRVASSRATARPTIPAPTTATSQAPSIPASVGAVRGPHDVARGRRGRQRRVEQQRDHGGRDLAGVPAADALRGLALDLRDAVEQVGDRGRDV